METLLLVCLVALGALTALTLFFVALLHRRVRRVSGMAAIALTVVSTLTALWGMGFLLRATAPVSDDVLLFGSTSHSVFALKASDATTLWSFSLPNPNSVIEGSALMQAGVVYASTDSGVYALAANDGHLLWHSTLPIFVQAGSISNGVIYGSFLQGASADQIAAISANDGHQLWQVAAPMNASNLAPTSGVVFIGSHGNEQDEILALDADSGQEMWKLPLDASGFLWLTAGSDGTVYGAVDAGNGLHHSLAFALNPSTRTLLWQHPLSAFPQPILTINERILYVGTGSAMVALHAGSGNEIWHFDLGPHVGTSSIVVDPGAVYFGTAGGFYVLHVSDGSLVWKHAEEDNMSFETALVSHGVVFSETGHIGPTPFFSDTSHYLYAFSVNSGQQYYRHFLSW